MGNKKNKAPDRIEISPEEEKALRERITKSQLTENDRNLLLSLLTLLQWIQGQLSRAKLTIKKLKKYLVLPASLTQIKIRTTNSNPPENPSNEQEK